MLAYKRAVINGLLWAFWLLPLVLGGGCAQHDDKNGIYNPYASVYGDSGTAGPHVFIDRDKDGVNDLCADVTVSASRVTPVVTFVVDGSSSMDRTFQNSRDNRWDVMVSTLEDVTSRLQSIVLFGMVLFSGPANNCPDLRTVDPALNNYDAVAQVLQSYRPTTSPPRYTPTALALDAAYALQPDMGIPDRNMGPHFIILCTDGNPNSCEAANNQFATGDPPSEFDGPVASVTNGYEEGIKTFIISLASEGPEYEQHLADLAEIGNPGTPAFSPSTQDALVAKLEEIVGGALGCKVALNGKVTVGQECNGEVILNSQSLPCNDPNGWRLDDERHIELLGTACDQFMKNTAAVLEAGFPCDTFTPEIII
jgi:hypothetical protein